MVFTSTEIIGLAVIAVVVLLIGVGVSRLDQRVGGAMDAAVDPDIQPDGDESFPAAPALPKRNRSRRRR